MTDCWKCGKQLTDLPKKLPFRETCPFCGSYLHCCKNCKFFAPGQPNQCLILGTDPISDRESLNYCEEFHLKEGKFVQTKKPEDVAKDLFKD